MPNDRPNGTGALRRRLWPLAGLLLLALLSPAAAAAETRTFVNFDNLFPTGGALTEGPATKFPSTIAVAGVAGTVTDVNMTTLNLVSASADDIDMALTGPNGQTVMLMSDACGETLGLTDEYFTFDDQAAGFLSNNGPCAPNQRASFQPSNYLGGAPEPEDFSGLGGPEGPFLNRLSFLAGGGANGEWKLWVFDDNSVGYFGFGLDGWVLTLEVEPPPPPPPTIVTVEVPVVKKPTGKRARALAKCKKKPNAEAKKRCRAKARKLPV